MPLPRDSSDIEPIDPDVFIGAYEYASMVSENEIIEEIPAIERFKIISEDSGEMRLANNLMNRFGLALVRHFRGDSKTMRSFMFRFWALEPLLEDPRFSKYIRQNDPEHPEVHRLMIEVACRLSLGTNYEFDPQAFLAELKSISESETEKE